MSALTASSTMRQCQANSKHRPRLGFVGAGWIGLHRMRAVAASGIAEVAAVADPSPEAVREAQQSAPEARTCASFPALLEMNLDGIVIATPSAMHAEQATLALRTGAAVFCQKPLARTAGETRRVIHAARDSNLLLDVDLSYREVRGVLEMRDLVRHGKLGRIFVADLVFHNAYGPDKSWFYDRRLSGGGCLIDLGTHLIDLAQWIMGYHRTSGLTSQLFYQGEPWTGAHGGSEAEDFAQVCWQTNTGAVVRLACSWRLSAGQDAAIEAAFYGTGGAGRMRNVNGSFYDFQVEHLRGTQRETLSAPPDEWGGRRILHWAQRLARGNRYDPSVESLIGVAETLDRSYGRLSSERSP